MRGAVSKATVKINQKEAPCTVRAGAGTWPSRNVARGDRVTTECHLTPALPGAWGPGQSCPRALTLAALRACSPALRALTAFRRVLSLQRACRTMCGGHLSLHGGSTPTCGRTGVMSDGQRRDGGGGGGGAGRRRRNTIKQANAFQARAHAC